MDLGVSQFFGMSVLGILYGRRPGEAGNTMVNCGIARDGSYRYEKIDL
jgi:hypothetical protein